MVFLLQCCVFAMCIYLFFKRRLYRKRVYVHFVYLSILQRITKIKKHRKTIEIGVKPQCQCFCCVKVLLLGCNCIAFVC